MSEPPLTRDVLSTEAVRRHGYFRPEAVTALLHDHVSGRADLSRQIWGLMAFALWLERYAAVREPASA